MREISFESSVIDCNIEFAHRAYERGTNRNNFRHGRYDVLSASFRGWRELHSLFGALCCNLSTFPLLLSLRMRHRCGKFYILWNVITILIKFKFLVWEAENIALLLEMVCSQDHFVKEKDFDHVNDDAEDERINCSWNSVHEHGNVLKYLATSLQFFDLSSESFVKRAFGMLFSKVFSYTRMRCF